MESGKMMEWQRVFLSVFTFKIDCSINQMMTIIRSGSNKMRR